MAKERRVTLAALNVALHAPHPAELYIQLFRRAFRSRRVVMLGTLHGVMIGSMVVHDQHERSARITGEFYRFVKLDPREPWFNAESNEPATEEEMERVNIPANLLPHLQVIPFFFNVRKHHLWFVSKDQKSTLGTSTALRFLNILLGEISQKADLPEVSVTILPESTSVDEILALPRLEYLRIELVRPNPDDGKRGEARWLRRMEEQRSSKMKLEITRARGEALIPDAETREMAEVAAENGAVYGRGRDPIGLPIEDSTVDKPMLRHEYLDTDIETVGHLLARIAMH